MKKLFLLFFVLLAVLLCQLTLSAKAAPDEVVATASYISEVSGE